VWGECGRGEPVLRPGDASLHDSRGARGDCAALERRSGPAGELELDGLCHVAKMADHPVALDDELSGGWPSVRRLLGIPLIAVDLYPDQDAHRAGLAKGPRHAFDRGGV